MYFDAKNDMDYALAFTACYQSESDINLREAKCLAMQVPYVLMPIDREEGIIGYMKTRLCRLLPAVRRLLHLLLLG